MLDFNPKNVDDDENKQDGAMSPVTLVTTVTTAAIACGFVYYYLSRNLRRSSEAMELRSPRLSFPPQLASLLRLLRLVPTLRTVNFPRTERYLDFGSSLIPISVSVSLATVVSSINQLVGHSVQRQSGIQLYFEELAELKKMVGEAKIRVEEAKITVDAHVGEVNAFGARVDAHVAEVKAFVARVDGHVGGVNSFVEETRAFSDRVDQLQMEVNAIEEKRNQQIQEVEERFNEYKRDRAEIKEGFNKVTMQFEELLDRLDEIFGQPEGESSQIGEREGETYLERRDRVIERLDRKNKQLEKLADERRALNEELNKPEVKKRVEAMTWMLRTRAKLVGKIARTFEDKLESLPEDIKETAVKVIEYSKKFYTMIPPNEIDEKLSNYYKEAELEEYRCPITLEVMVEPVKIVDPDGHAHYFERLALQRYYDEAVMETGNFSLPTRPDIALIESPEELPIDEEMRSRIQNLLRKAEENPKFEKAGAGSESNIIDAVVESSSRSYVNHYGMRRETEGEAEVEANDDLGNRVSLSP